MNVWLIVVAVLALVVALMRVWFRWFSRRPLSSTDDYAMAVDADVDGVAGSGGPSAATGTGTVPTPGTGRRVRTGPIAGPRPVPPAPPGTTAAPRDEFRLPRQRTAADPRIPTDGISSSGGHAATPRVHPPGS
ncbi:hypothetical protein [Nakamurella deserti]|uniref:hypothetical protein n=1 Tax=Nakamurella deserti TaxID=2164074 RepID=UPI000DBE7CA5|nr:hypothetical protein [Nakamurella deserti]